MGATNPPGLAFATADTLRYRPPTTRLAPLMPRAPRQCPGAGGTCTNLIRGSARYCPDHDVPWRGPRTASSRITSTSAWQKQQREFLRHHRYCEIRYPGICTGRATTVDKKQPAARRPDLALDPDNWQAACRPCNEHKARTEDRR